MIKDNVEFQFRSEELEKTIHKIASELRKSKLSDLSLMNGSFGRSFFLYYYSQFFGCKDSKDAYNRLVYKLISTLNNSRNIVHTYCDGLIGALTAFTVIASFDKNYNGIVDKSTDEAIAGIMVRYFNEGNYDFMHGALGALNYFRLRLSSCNEESTKRDIEDFLTLGTKKLFQVGLESDTELYWQYYLYNKPEVEGLSCSNIGFAHGTPGILTFLSSLYSLGVLRNEIRPKIKKIVSFLLSVRRTNGFSQFPRYFSEGYNFNYDSPIAWCYGDLGNSMALLRAGEALNEPEWLNIALDIAEISTNRRTLRETVVMDTGICHGTVGAVHIYQKLYDRFKSYKCMDARNFWIDKTLEYSNFKENSIAGFRKFVDDGCWQKSEGLLTGVSGIGLVLMSQLGISSEWDKFLILD